MRKILRGIILIGVMLLSCCTARGQTTDPLRRDKERTVFSFRLKDSGKYLSILESTDKENLYLVYRFGTASAVELEFPKEKKGPAGKFSYWFFMRGGGAENEGVDVNHLSFTVNGWQYLVYDEYAAADKSQEVGVRIIRLKDCKMLELVGRPESRLGSLLEFRDHDAVRHVENEDYDSGHCR